MGCFQIKVLLSPSYLMMLASPSRLIFSEASRSAISFSQSQTGQTYRSALLAVRRRTPHWAQENSAVWLCSAMVLMGSWQTGHLAFSPFDWSNTTIFPQCGHSRPVSLSVRT